MVEEIFYYWWVFFCFCNWWNFSVPFLSKLTSIYSSNVVTMRLCEYIYMNFQILPICQALQYMNSIFFFSNSVSMHRKAMS
jgi:hypothetical protein